MSGIRGLCRLVAGAGFDQMPYLITCRLQLVACNGLLAATSFLMSDLDDLSNMLETSLPDWDEVYQNLPHEVDIRSRIDGGES